MKEWGLVGDFAAIVHGEQPVVLLEHREGHHGLARLSFGIELGKTEEREEGKAAENQQAEQGCAPGDVAATDIIESHINECSKEENSLKMTKLNKNRAIRKRNRLQKY